MPGIEPTSIAYASYGAVKFAGYSLAGYFLNHHYNDESHRALTIGASRTALGMAAGFLYLHLGGQALFNRNLASFYVALFPIRCLEWLILLWYFYNRRLLYDRRLATKGRVAKAIIAATLWSYALDLIAVVLLPVIPGAMEIC